MMRKGSYAFNILIEALIEVIALDAAGILQRFALAEGNMEVDPQLC